MEDVRFGLFQRLGGGGVTAVGGRPRYKFLVKFVQFHKICKFTNFGTICTSVQMLLMASGRIYFVCVV